MENLHLKTKIIYFLQATAIDNSRLNFNVNKS